MALVVKNSPANAGHLRNLGLIPGSGRSSGGGNDNQLQYSCLESPMGREALGATIHGLQSRTQLSTYAHTLHRQCRLTQGEHMLAKLS